MLMVLVCGGCGAPALDVPAQVTEVEANRMLFLQPEDDPLLDIEPGTVVDDLAKLQGCWGVFVQQQTTSGPFEGFEFLRFDFEAGELLRQILIRNPLAASVTQDVFTLERGVRDDTLSLDLLEASGDFSSPLFDLFAIFTPNSGSASGAVSDPANANPFTISLTLDGDAFVITASTQQVADNSFPFVDGAIYRRLDCPSVESTQ